MYLIYLTILGIEIIVAENQMKKDKQLIQKLNTLTSSNNNNIFDDNTNNTNIDSNIDTLNTTLTDDEILNILRVDTQ